MRTEAPKLGVGAKIARNGNDGMNILALLRVAAKSTDDSHIEVDSQLAARINTVEVRLPLKDNH